MKYVLAIALTAILAIMAIDQYRFENASTELRRAYGEFTYRVMVPNDFLAVVDQEGKVPVMNAIVVAHVMADTIPYSQRYQDALSDFRTKFGDANTVEDLGKVYESMGRLLEQEIKIRVRMRPWQQFGE